IPEPIQKVEVRASKKKKFKNLLPLATSPSRRKNLQYSTFDIARKLYGGDISKAMEFWADNEHKGQILTDEHDNTDIQAPPSVELFFGEGNKSRKIIEQERITMGLGGLEASPTFPLQMWSNNFAELIKSYENNDEFANKDWILLALSPLAKLRLIDEDPIFSDLYCLWANQLEKEEAYEQAAILALMLGDSSADERISRYFEDQEIRSSKKSNQVESDNVKPFEE
ncbi:18934_t:CDS:2, partial [Racocetra fulgida]